MSSRRSASAFLVICGTLSLTGRPPKTRVCGRRKDYQKLRDAAADTADDAKSTEMDAPGVWESIECLVTKHLLSKHTGCSVRLLALFSIMSRMP